mmetsp:Transcript_6685/g.15491  ORF Transcript_6685/g.15491 Transcript_6685/m.15491 type:complete len:239 (-) Transcript_6685:453-1169(-)
MDQGNLQVRQDHEFPLLVGGKPEALLDCDSTSIGCGVILGDQLDLLPLPHLVPLMDTILRIRGPICQQVHEHDHELTFISVVQKCRIDSHRLKVVRCIHRVPRCVQDLAHSANCTSAAASVKHGNCSSPHPFKPCLPPSCEGSHPRPLHCMRTQSARHSIGSPGQLAIVKARYLVEEVVGGAKCAGFIQEAAALTDGPSLDGASGTEPRKKASIPRLGAVEIFHGLHLLLEDVQRLIL